MCDITGEGEVYWNGMELPKRDSPLMYLRLALAFFDALVYLALMVFSSIAIHRVRMQRLRGAKVESFHELDLVKD